MTVRPAPPLYLECYPMAAGAPSRFIVDADHPATIEPGAWQCDVRAPNGGHVSLPIETVSGILSRGDLADLIGTGSAIDSPVSLARRPIEPTPLDRVSLGLWSDDRMIPREHWVMTGEDLSGEDPVSTISTDSSSTIDYIQVVIDDGPSMVVRCPPATEVTFRYEQVNSSLPVRPVITDGAADVDISAYWGFTRHSIRRGAFDRGQRMAERCLGSDAAPSVVIVAAHWATVFGIDDARLVDAIRAKLVARPADDGDALVMAWVLDFDRGSEDDVDAVGEAFWPVLDSVLDKRPLYSGTMKLLSDRLSAITRLHRDRIRDAPAIERKVATLWDVAEAMTWDSEYTTYRGLRPDRPDRKALSAHLDEGAKKKFTNCHVGRVGFG